MGRRRETTEAAGRQWPIYVEFFFHGTRKYYKISGHNIYKKFSMKLFHAIVSYARILFYQKR